MKIKFGAIVVAGSGKIGGHVASKNRGGAYLRTKVTPTNPNTSSQNASRSLLGSLSTGWSGLQESQRNGWNGAVNDYASTDIFGDIKNPSGINLYVKLNANLAKSGQAFISDAPAKKAVAYSALESVVFSAGTLANSKITFADSELDGSRVVVRATPKVSNGTSFVKSEYRDILSATVVAGEVSFGQAYIDKFGNLAELDKMFVSVQVIENNGQAGIAQSMVCIASV